MIALLYFEWFYIKQKKKILHLRFNSETGPEERFTKLQEHVAYYQFHFENCSKGKFDERKIQFA